ncbi:MAG: thiamine pyrophosphate-dependent dehydrogenase E1 component subunit alpha [Anaerolineae bacterium]|nr:thiamine pyrophosphate-dependent dehydrogenase E1 component subunit alpha [Thermoflexales bacterium]MDW8406716.1 thiamine pyrophosphate-dependent dehydrogenase E1 component subunit alpha [Anaerolineae bacterium]
MNHEFAVQALRHMLRIRLFEERTLEVLMQGKLASTMCHVSIGQEAVAAGVCMAMQPQDYLTSTHRGHGHLIARGGDLGRMMAELMGKETGYCKGRGGSMHITDMALGHLGANGIVGGHIGIAVGAGLWSKLSANNAVTMCLFGDGAVTEGVFHEALNMAAVFRLPVVFVCENNQYAMSLPWSKSTPAVDFKTRAAAYAMPGIDVDGQDVAAVYQAAREAAERARRGDGPTLIGAHTYRFFGHSRGDPSAYRDPEEERRWRERDPIPLFKARALSAGWLSQDDMAALEADARQAMDDAVQFAEAAPPARDAVAFEDVYAPSGAHSAERERQHSTL